MTFIIMKIKTKTIRNSKKFGHTYRMCPNFLLVFYLPAFVQSFSVTRPAVHTCFCAAKSITVSVVGVNLSQCAVKQVEN